MSADAPERTGMGALPSLDTVYRVSKDRGLL